MSTTTDTSLKFRQAAFGYLIVGILYESAVWVAWRNGLAHPARGPVWLWLLMGAAIVGLVFWALYSLQQRWVARLIFVLHALRVPTFLKGAFLATADTRLPASLYLFALVILLLNLWLMARAGWDL
ncbi:MAG: hypothetical protein ACT443_01800 [Gemmatimonadota bacterium]